MSHSGIAEKTLDDVMRRAIEEVLEHGTEVVSSKGQNRELTGVLLEIADPRSRLSRTEIRGKPFSCLGELCWYLSGDNSTAFISYYIRDYQKYDENGVIHGAYGPRMLGVRTQNQLKNVVGLLTKRPSTRQAVVQIFEAKDLVDQHKDVPCTCNLQFLVRQDRLHLLSTMRSNDIYLGLPHDIFCFTMIQEIIARELGIEVGTYRHFVGSLHLYDDNYDDARSFLNEGYQSTRNSMPPMPKGDPWPNVRKLLEAEKLIREQGITEFPEILGVGEYWADLIRLLQLYWLSREQDLGKMKHVAQQIGSPVYEPFVRKRIEDVEEKKKRHEARK